MKHLITLLIAVVMAMGASAAVAQSNLWIVVPDDGDTVNANGFTIVAKAQGDLSACDLYRVYVVVANESDGEVYTSRVDKLGTIDSDPLEIIKPTSSDLDGTAHRSIDGKLPIVAQARGVFAKGDFLTMQVVFENGCEGTFESETAVVTTR